MNNFELSWQRAWSNLGIDAPSDLYAQLVAAYAELHRRYHTLQHLGECIAHFSVSLGLARYPGEVEIALWFHDAIYELGDKHNEQRSAEWALRVLNQVGASDKTQNRVYALILATCHDVLPMEADQQLLVDIDLAILGAPPARFNEYDQQVRAEYSEVPDFLYKIKRKEILKGFLIREHIFSTSYFRARYEQQARSNLQAVTA